MADIEDVAVAAANMRAPRPEPINDYANDDHDDCGCSGGGGAGDCAATPPLPPPTTRSNIAAVARSGTDIPGDATVYVHTFGCGHNVSDSEYMSGQLFQHGYRITDEFANADCFLINSCTVKNPSEDHFVTLVRRAKATAKPVICAGCVPAGDPKGAEWRDVSVIGVRQIHRVTEVVQEALRGNTVRLFDTPEQQAAGTSTAAATTGKRRGGGGASKKDATAASSKKGDDDDEATNKQQQKLPSLLLPKVRRNRFVEIIPINVGCLNTCTYCKTKHARGDLQSWPVADIVQRVRDSVADGVCEIHLTSEDTGAYGIDIGTDIVQLLRAVLAVLEPTDVMLRLGMTNPPYLLKHLDTIGPLFRHKNMFEFVHLPVQSGSNAILEIMKREYSVEEFKHCVDRLLFHCPSMTLSTDIICAFPFEGDAEWRETMKLCRDIKFPVLNISRFYPRRGTPAAAMKQIPTDVAKKRTQELSQLFNSETALLTKSAQTDLSGKEQRIWVTETAYDKHHLVGHTKQFVQVLVDPAEAALGDLVAVTVKTEDALRFCVKGKVVKVLARSKATANPSAAAASAAAATKNAASASGQAADATKPASAPREDAVVVDGGYGQAPTVAAIVAAAAGVVAATVWWWRRGKAV